MKHGGDISTAIESYGGNAGEWLDLSTGINPVPYPAAHLISQQGLISLPTQQAEAELYKAARRAYGIPEGLGVAIAPGTQAIISALPRLLQPDTPISIVSPTYSSHEESWSAAGNPVEIISAHDLEQHQSPNCLLVNPNNPDGAVQTPEQLLKLATTQKEQGGYLIVDEAFMDVMPQNSVVPLISDENILVLRSFGKFFGLAGVRLGFLIGPKQITDKLQQVFGSWAVSGPALDIGTAALHDLNWQNDMRSFLSKEMHIFADQLRAQNLSILGKTDLYILIEHQNAHQLHELLAQQKIWTRVFDYSTTWMRLGLPPHKNERDKFIKALKKAQEQMQHHAPL
ncbi:threonine-phosphate decarboxylase CobD [Pseudovibrio sp. Tun.PSC04-5.I4]|uniref:threonine-phosphate decarboxylase CobD n=1 Tax=Pseudovibrio sp. Tun.PSC04-5.I4 TaxID=1798213 RepID=UPI00088B5D11|nr:threonine-phosphate decarboxylase CobD [Pseudovibrio sp. Tun.PSC04-5.I4]SDR11340.1 L-threonine O-3-phosphate decarboxylase [Pseudovibrio sp. Tun.PSC04-5.I4]